MAKKCSLEGISVDLANLNRILIGNGTKGIIRKVDEVMTRQTKLESQNTIKLWIYKGMVGILLMITSSLLTYRFFM